MKSISDTQKSTTGYVERSQSPENPMARYLPFEVIPFLNNMAASSGTYVEIGAG